MSAEKKKNNLLGIVCALDSEGAALRAWFPNPEQTRFHQYQWIDWTAPEPRISVVISGPGKFHARRATQMLIERDAPHWILNFGTAGAIAQGLRIGDIVLAQSTAEYLEPVPLQELFPTSPELLNLAGFSNQIQCGPIVSANKVIKSEAQKQELYARYQALCGDWESAVVMRVCREHQIKGIALRVISDFGNEQAISDFEFHHRIVLEKAASLLKHILTESGIFSQCR